MGTQEADLIMCIGSRFDDRITGNLGAFIPEAKKASEEDRGGVIHVDIRLSENAKQVEPNFFVHSTGKTFLTQINSYIERIPQDRKANFGKNTKNWIARMKELQEEFPVKVPKFNSQEIIDSDTNQSITKTPMSAQHIISVLNDLILQTNKMDDCLFTTGVGIHQMVAAQLITDTTTTNAIIWVSRNHGCRTWILCRCEASEWS